MRIGLGATVLLALSGCAQLPPTADSAFAAFVVIGDSGAVARVLTSAPACPAILLDQVSSPMHLRAGPAALAQRPSISKAADAKAAHFPLLTCEQRIAPGIRTASVLGRALALPKPQAQRIVVIGDTGCQLKKSGNFYQACNDAEQYPFAQIAKAAAAWKPDLVIHVGDYHYRENACPEGNAGCAGSSWGYGWDAWRDDFFHPAAPLLQAAPWVMARGNHESCARGGQGYWRFLDPRPLQKGRDCNDPADDAIGNYSDPYAVALGAGAQLLVIDSAATPWNGFKEGDAGLATYRANYRKLDALAQQAPYNIGLVHHPILAFGAERNAAGGVTLAPGAAGLQQAYGALNPRLLPKPVQLMLSGHVHVWQQLSFSSDHPSQLVAGFSGTAEDLVPLPASIAPGSVPAPGAIVEHFSSWVDGFGFMTMERSGPEQWDVTVRNQRGAVQNTCKIDGSKSVCTLAQVK